MRFLYHMLLALMFLPAVALAASPPTLDLPDALFAKGRYQEALKGYEGALQSSDETTRLKALYRAVEAEALLFRYAEAAQRAAAAPAAPDPLWRARLLILRAETALAALRQYGAAPAREQWAAEASAAYNQLWTLRPILVRRALKDEAYFVDVKGASLESTPTLWDFAVLRWTGFILERGREATSTAKPSALALLGESYGGPWRAQDPPAAQAAALYEDASRHDSAGREAARELWKVRRLMIAVGHPGLVDPAGDALNTKRLALARLLSWVELFREPAARAEAGWQAAQLLQNMDRLAEAVDLCKRLERDWPAQRPSRLCAQARARLELPELNLTGRFAPPPGKGTLRLWTRNLGKAHVRLYRLAPETLLGRGLPGRPAQDWSALRGPGAEVLADYAARRPDFSWSVTLRAPADYAGFETAADPPPLSAGLYLALASSDDRFAPKSSLLAGVIVNVTDLLLVTTAGPRGPEADFAFNPAGPATRLADGFHFYALDALTGRPAAAALDIFQRVQWRGAERISRTADEQGMSSLGVDFDLRYTHSTNVSVDALARRGASLAFGAGPVHVAHHVPAPIELMLETDRPIYRPNQKVRGKVSVLRRLPRGYKTYDGASQVALVVSDVNGQKLYNDKLKLDAFGAAAFEFAIPSGGLLGQYHAIATIAEQDHQFSGSAQFLVEEYKRPEFEVAVAESTGAWRYGRAATVAGSARYYFGGAVAGAAISYRVHRQDYVPWFCWWWRQQSGGGRVEVAAGQTRADDEGRWSFSITPQPPDASAPEPRPSDFIVEAEARDAGGRTISGTRTFRAGAKAYLFDIAPPVGFFTAGKAAEVPVTLRGLDERALSGRGRFWLHRIAGQPKPPAKEENWRGWFGPTPPLEEIYREAEDGPLVAQGALDFISGKPARALLGALSEGAYRLTVSAEDPWGGKNEQKVVLLSVSENPGRSWLALPSVAIPERASYLPGETARLFVGSGLLDAAYLEVWGGPALLERRCLRGGLHLIKLRINEDHKGGFTARWFGARQFKIHSGQASAAVPWADKELSLKLDAAPAMRPGARVSWRLRVADRDGRPVEGQALVRIFDRSLEYYSAIAPSWLTGLYRQRGQPREAHGSFFSPHSNHVPVERGWIDDILKSFRQAIAEPRPAALRLSRSSVHGGYRRYNKHRFEGGEEDALPSASAPMALEEKSSRQFAGQAAEAPAPVAARSNFSETAYFEPRLPVRAGKAVVSFTAPEQLTSWKIQARVLTRDVKRGSVEALTATRKELMVRVEIPRFYREGDEGRIRAVVHNETDRDVSGTVTLDVQRDGKPAEAALGLSGLSLPFLAKARGLSAASWSVKAPRGSGTFLVRAVARAGTLADAEQRELPLLPSRARLIESALISLDGGGARALALAAFAQEDPTRVNEALDLQLDPQLALTVLNSLPFLVRYPHECVEQVLERYVPLAVVNAFYRKDPRIAQAVGKIPRRDALTPAWDRSDPRRLTTLMESPWEQTSKGRVPDLEAVDLLDPKIVAAEQTQALAKLKSYQNPDGSYSWFPGGRPDPYMTLLVLAGFAEAQRYGVEPPADVVRRALGYVGSEIPKRLKPEEREVALILFAAYVVTSFPRSLPEGRQGFRFAKVWADYADKHADAMTPLGRAYAAYVYWRLGEKAKGEEYLARAMDGAREDKIAGVYWQPEKLSWLWYHDTVEKHAFLLKTLLAIRPNDPRIPGMAQWLLFNRKGNEWKSTKAAAAAIYSLLDLMRARGSLDRGDQYSIRWGSRVYTAHVSPLDWLAKPLRWSARGEQIGPRDGEARIEKTGPGLAFASLTWIYTTDKPAKESGEGMLRLSRAFFRRHQQDGSYRLAPLKESETVSVGDEIEVHLTVKSKSQFEYLHLKDPKFAGFEAEQLLSGWKWDQLGRYEEPRDSLTNFFIHWLPHGEYVLRYRLRPTTPGRYRVGPAVLQSMYAPELSAHSDSFALEVRD